MKSLHLLAKKLNRKLKNEKTLSCSWYTQVTNFKKKLAQSYGDQNASQFQRVLKSKDQEITTLKSKLNIPLDEQVDLATLAQLMKKISSLLRNLNSKTKL